MNPSKAPHTIFSGMNLRTSTRHGISHWQRKGQSGGSTRSLTSCISNASWSQWKAARTVRSVSIPRNSGLEMSSSESCRGCNSELKSLQRLLKMSAYLQGDFRRRSTCMLTHEVVLKNSSNFKQSRSLRISFYALSSMTRRMAPNIKTQELACCYEATYLRFVHASCMRRLCRPAASTFTAPWESLRGIWNISHGARSKCAIKSTNSERSASARRCSRSQVGTSARSRSSCPWAPTQAGS